MKKSIFIIITVFLMFNPYTAYAKQTHQAQSQMASISISLENLKDGAQYQYNGLKWKSKLKDVKKEFPYTLKPLKYENLSANYKEQIYVANGTFNLQGQNAILKLQFVDGELSQFLYAFHLDETYDEWFETQCDNLRMLYGEETSWNINYSSIKTCHSFITIDSFGRLRIKWRKSNQKTRFERILYKRTDFSV